MDFGRNIASSLKEHFMRKNEIERQFHIEKLNACYVSSIDNNRLEEWPHYFIEDCLYRIKRILIVADRLELFMLQVKIC